MQSYFWSVLPSIRTEYRKIIRTRNDSLFGHFSCSDLFPFRDLKLKLSNYCSTERKDLLYLMSFWKHFRQRQSFLKSDLFTANGYSLSRQNISRTAQLKKGSQNQLVRNYIISFWEIMLKIINVSLTEITHYLKFSFISSVTSLSFSKTKLLCETPRYCTSLNISGFKNTQKNSLTD